MLLFEIFISYANILARLECIGLAVNVFMEASANVFMGFDIVIANKSWLNVCLLIDSSVLYKFKDIDMKQINYVWSRCGVKKRKRKVI